MNCLWCLKKSYTACHWKKKPKPLIKVISRKGWKWTAINLFPSAIHHIAGMLLLYCAAGIAHGRSCRPCSAVSPSSWWRRLFSPCPRVFSSSVSTLSWQFRIASWMLRRFHWVLGRASSTVKTPSRVLRTCVHTAEDFSSRPISWTIFRRYCWVSCKQWISRRTEKLPSEAKLWHKLWHCKSRHHSQLRWKNWFGRRH